MFGFTPLVKVCLSAAVSLLSVVLFFCFKGPERKWCMLGMISSTLGDVFMTDVIGMGAASTYPGAAFFILAHILYGVCFVRACRRKGYRLVNKGFLIGILVVVMVTLVLTGLMFKVTGKMQGMYLPLLAYIAFIGFNLVCQFSYGYSEQGLRGLLILGMFLFIVSDLLVFLPMVNVCEGTHDYNSWIWYLYLPAQLLIVLFNSDFKKKTEEKA